MFRKRQATCSQELSDRNMSIEQDRILTSREKRANRIALFEIEGYIVASIRANIPGNRKNTNHASMLVKYYSCCFGADALETRFYKSHDGPYALKLFLDIDPMKLKKDAMELEDATPLGRLVDIDIHVSGRQLSRGYSRRCLLCDRPAHECIRLGRHDIHEIWARIDRIVDQWLNKKIANIIDKAIIGELDLEPKFGLVTENDPGSHKDMDHSLMVKAKDSLAPFFMKIFRMGYEADKLDGLFDKIRKVGIDAETRMFASTNNINAYKGLIFSLGIILAATGYALGHTFHFSEVFVYVRKMSRGITAELDSGTDTFGKQAYQKYNFKGARGEAESGFPSIRKALKHYQRSKNRSLYRLLVDLIIDSEDTVFLKRSGSLENYLEYKRVFREFSDYSDAGLKTLTDYCVERGLSFGGSADLLVCTLFLCEIKRVFFASARKKKRQSASVGTWY